MSPNSIQLTKKGKCAGANNAVLHIKNTTSKTTFKYLETIAKVKFHLHYQTKF